MCKRNEGNCSSPVHVQTVLIDQRVFGSNMAPVQCINCHSAWLYIHVDSFKPC